MANEMSSFVRVHSDNPHVAIKLKEIFKHEEGKYEANALNVINNIKGTNYTFSSETTKEDWDKEVDFPPNELWEELIGTKWMNVEYEHGDVPTDCNIVLRSAWNVPISFLITLRNILQEIDPDCYITGTYEDETYNPSGAFVYGKFDYDDIEDYDEKYDWEESVEDDLYNEKWSYSLIDLEGILKDGYIEYLEDRVNNPSDYE